MALENDQLNVANHEDKTIGLRDFLDKYFRLMPVWIQIVTYLIILLIFTYITLSMTTMNIVMSGKIDKSAIDTSELGDIYYVEIDQGNGSYTKLITNSEDRFYKSLTLTQFLAAKSSGLRATVLIKVKSGNVVSNTYPISNPNFVLKSSKKWDEFDTIEYDGYVDKIKSARTESTKQKQAFSLVSSAYAGESSNSEAVDSSNNKIYIEKIYIPSGYSGSEINLSLGVFNNNKFQQLIPTTNRETRSATYKIAISPGKTTYTNGRYYFQLPQSPVSKLQFVSKSIGGILHYFQKAEADIDLNYLSSKFGVSEEITLNNQIKLTVRYSNPHEIVFFKVGDQDNDVVKSIREQSQKDGYYMFEIPTNTGQKSNAVFAQLNTPPKAIQDVIRYAITSGFELKTVQCSGLITKARNQIQVGFSNKYKIQKPITQERLNDFLKVIPENNQEAENNFRKLCDHA